MPFGLMPLAMLWLPPSVRSTQPVSALHAKPL